MARPSGAPVPLPRGGGEGGGLRTDAAPKPKAAFSWIQADSIYQVKRHPGTSDVAADGFSATFAR